MCGWVWYQNVVLAFLFICDNRNSSRQLLYCVQDIGIYLVDSNSFRALSFYLKYYDGNNNK